MENQTDKKKPRILCLHGFRTSAAILNRLVDRWPETILEKLDLVFLDAPFPARGKSDVEGIFDPPYYEWFQTNEDFTEYTDFEECLAYIEDYMVEHGPFDGVLGFSQGVILSAALPGMQKNCVALTKVPNIKFLVIISGAKFGGSKFGMPKLAANAFASAIQCPSIHFIGETDFMKAESTADTFLEQLVMRKLPGFALKTDLVRLGYGERGRDKKMISENEIESKIQVNVPTCRNC